MNIKDQICSALCYGFKITEVPIGYAVKSPFRWLTGDFLVFYIRKSQDQYRLEDDGLTISELEGEGVDFTSETRMETMADLLSDHNITYDQSQYLFHSSWFRSEELGNQAVAFLSFMNRVQDFVFTTRTRVAGTFREDLIASLLERFGEDHVSLRNAPVAQLAYYTVDIVVRSKNGRMAAIYPATSENKALEAILFAKEVELKDIGDVIPFLIYENAASNMISRSTRSKAMNSQLQMGDWGGGRLEVIDKIGKHVEERARA